VTLHDITHNVDRHLAFDGVLLASVSSADGSKMRWAELALYRTDSCEYVLHGVGATRVPGEEQRSWVHVTPDAADVIRRLQMQSSETGATYLPNTAARLLADAARLDRGIADAYTYRRV
jgi:hypothetical protein